eukprot:599346-Prymnesium_polylepis.1
MDTRRADSAVRRRRMPAERVALPPVRARQRGAATVLLSAAADGGRAAAGRSRAGNMQTTGTHTGTRGSARACAPYTHTHTHAYHFTAGRGTKVIWRWAPRGRGATCHRRCCTFGGEEPRDVQGVFDACLAVRSQAITLSFTARVSVSS